METEAPTIVYMRRNRRRITLFDRRLERQEASGRFLRVYMRINKRQARTVKILGDGLAGGIRREMQDMRVKRKTGKTTP